MKGAYTLFILLLAGASLHAQYVYTINADSVKITNHCDTAELILENHTQNVPGFLFNKGRGRTEFRRAAVKINDSSYLIGADTVVVKNPHAFVNNGNTFGANAVLGTLDNYPLSFFTNNTERLRITANGDIAVPTFSQGRVLYSGTGGLLQNDASLQWDSAHQAMGIGVQPIPPYRLALGNGGAALLTSAGSPYIDFNTVGVGNKTWRLLTQYDNGSFNITDTTNSNSIFHIAKGNNNVSIGTNTDAGGYKLTVSNTEGDYGLAVIARMSTFLSTASPAMTSPVVAIACDNSNETYGHLILNGLTHGTRRFGIGVNTEASPSYAFLDMYDIAGSTLPIKFSAAEYDFRDGNVGIGISAAPTAQLHTTGTVRFAGLTADTSLTRVLVSDASGNLYYRNLSSWASNGIFKSDLAVRGTLSAQQVKIMPAAWADYVFDKTYHLPSLPEVENYIKQNNHLPGMPAVAEVRQKGIEIGESQAALLQKIEELTLYAIEQGKQLQQQNKTIDTLKEQCKELSSLKQEMEELKKMIRK